MRFDLTQLGRHGRGDDQLDRTYEPSAFRYAGQNVDDEGYAIVAPVHLVMDVHKQAEVYRVTGRVDGTLRLDCGRCLEPFDVPVDTTFELRYVPASENEGEGEREVADDDLTTAFYRENAIDLEELIREQFQLALPMKPLCSEACKGLCPECGANLNTNPCECKPTWADPRLGELSELLKNAKHS
ncbi:MAG TPA: DUF177 domain-containing protein [Vicinamibacterales bacterium]|jgi:uncharacterized protein|nr:DUF177 domain-containing protein [Vicinamibacterales bacterium]